MMQISFVAISLIAFAVPVVFVRASDADLALNDFYDILYADDETFDTWMQTDSSLQPAESLVHTITQHPPPGFAVPSGNGKIVPQSGWLPITQKSPHEVQRESEPIKTTKYSSSTQDLVGNPFFEVRKKTANAPPITVFPNDTIVIHYETVAFPPDSSIEANGVRKSRSTVPKSIQSRLETLKLSCTNIDVEEFIVDLLRSPLRVRNAIVKGIEARIRPENIRTPTSNQQNNINQGANVRRPKAVQSQTGKVNNRPRPTGKKNIQAPVPQVKSIPTNVVQNNGRSSQSINKSSNDGPTLSSSDTNSAVNDFSTKEFISAQFSNFPAFQKKFMKQQKAPQGSLNINRGNGQFGDTSTPKKVVKTVTQKPTVAQPPQPVVINKPLRPVVVNKPSRPVVVTQPPPTRQPFSQPPVTSTASPVQTSSASRVFTPNQVKKSNSKSGSNNESTTGRINKTFSIEKFLERYPEVRRVSSRFGDNKPAHLKNFGKPPQQEEENQEERNLQNQQQQPKQFNQRKQKKLQKHRRKQQRRKQQKLRQKQAHQQQKLQKQQKAQNPAVPSIIFNAKRPVVVTQPPSPPASTAPFPVSFESTRVPDAKNSADTSLNDGRDSKSIDTEDDSFNEVSGFDDFDDANELSSEEYSYLYYEDYYEELVPEHHRFNQLQDTVTSTTTQTPKIINTRVNENKQQSFGFFQSHPAEKVTKTTFTTTERTVAPAAIIGNFPNFPIANSREKIPPPRATSSRKAVNKKTVRKPRPPSVIQVTTRAPPAPTTPAPPASAPTPAPSQAPVVSNASPSTQSGPFGYPSKGTFFSDEASIGFPIKMEVIYQGFVWAIRVCYEPNAGGCVMHGGIHTILKDKVKRETLDLRDDYIVRVTGRASPYNINRLTFYTANGKTYGPWGDRRSKESVDFDVSAPKGQALGFMSGTVDFGVPLRSISFHWRPRPT